MMDRRYFSRATFAFLRELAQNNEKYWFEANKQRYLADVRNLALGFIEDFRPHLKRVSPHFQADARPVGGSLFRIYRDTRFSKDKSPYKTHVGIQFRHMWGKDVHAPGFYLHIEPGNVFAGVGIWHPDAATLRKIRDAIAGDPIGWKRNTRGKFFRRQFELAGESLQRPPRGYDPEHTCIEDIKRKDFVGYCRLSQKFVTSAGFLLEFAGLCRIGAPLVRYLCRALELPY